MLRFWSETHAADVSMFGVNGAGASELLSAHSVAVLSERVDPRSSNFPVRHETFLTILTDTVACAANCSSEGDHVTRKTTYSESEPSIHQSLIAIAKFFCNFSSPDEAFEHWATADPAEKPLDLRCTLASILERRRIDSKSILGK